MSKEEIYKQKNFSSFNQIIANYEELSKNDWELHKKYIEEGHNPNEIAKIIRNDEIEKLQEISSQPKFDFNQRIKPSLYERCSFVNKKNVTLIEYAAFFSSIKCFKYLLMNGANVENTGKYAIACGNEEIIHLCEQNHSSFKDAYETAIEFHRNDIFNYLYENRIIEIDDIEKLGSLCIMFWNIEVFMFLQKNGMKINENILNNMVKIGNLYLIKYFLKENPIPKNIFAYSPELGNIELVEYLLNQKEIDINAKDDNGATALICASEFGYTEIVKILLEQEGIDINVKDDDGDTALILASQFGYIEIVKLLLEQKGIDINAQNEERNTALITASYEGHTEIVKLLLEQEGIDINAKNNDGDTALICASSNGHTEIVKLLLEQEGIDINAKNDEGDTALMLASEKGYTEIVKILNEKGAN